MKKKTQLKMNIYGIALLLSSMILTPLASLSIWADTLDSLEESSVSFYEEETTDTIEESLGTIDGSMESGCLEESTIENTETNDLETENPKDSDENRLTVGEEISVSTSIEFFNAYTNLNVRKITLLKDITVTQSLRDSPLTRSLEIDGQGYKLSMASNANFRLGELSTEAEKFTLKNVELSKTTNGTVVYRTTALGYTSSGKGWTVSFDGFSLADPAMTLKLVDAGEGAVEIIDGHYEFDINTAPNVLKQSRFIEAKSIKISGKDTKITAKVGKAITFAGTNQAESDFELSDGASLRIDATDRGVSEIPLIEMNGDHSIFSLSNQASLEIDASAEISLLVGKEDQGDGLIEITDQANLTAQKLGVSTDKLTVNHEATFHANQLVLEKENSELVIADKGEMTVKNTEKAGASDSTAAIYSTKRGQSIVVKDLGSALILESENGPGLLYNLLLNKSDFQNEIIVKDLGSLTMKGQVATGGIIQASASSAKQVPLKVVLENPLFVDWENRAANGVLFSNMIGKTNAHVASFTGNNSALSLWKQGDSKVEPAKYAILDSNFHFSGDNFSVIEEGEIQSSEEVTTGLSRMNRLKVLNDRIVLADELYVPTTADKKIYGHFSIFEEENGTIGFRDAVAYDPITARIAIQRKGQEIFFKEITGEEIKSVAAYNQPERAGMFEIVLDQFLQAGDTVVITDIKLENGHGYKKGDVITTFDVRPPEPAKFEIEEISTKAKELEGTAAPLSKVMTEIIDENGQYLRSLPDTSTDSKGAFTVDLATAALQTGEQLQVFLKDSAGSAAAAGVKDLPETNDKEGNMNPRTTYEYHDATGEDSFPAATILQVITGPSGRLTLNEIDEWSFGLQEIRTVPTSYPVTKSPTLTLEDLRPFEEESCWSLAVSQTSFQTEDEKYTLRDANLSFGSAKLTGKTWDGQEIESINIPGETLSESLTPIITDDLLQSQRGIFKIEFHQVQLNLSARSNPKALTYTSTLNWELQNVPK